MASMKVTNILKGVTTGKSQSLYFELLTRTYGKSLANKMFSQKTYYVRHTPAFEGDASFFNTERTIKLKIKHENHFRYLSRLRAISDLRNQYFKDKPGCSEMEFKLFLKQNKEKIQTTAKSWRKENKESFK